jgi:hypothetical protein
MALYELPDGTVLGISPRGFEVVDLPAPASGYDLAAALATVASEAFTVNMPTAPTITTEATCTTVAEVNASVAVNGRRTIIAAGTYNFGGALSIGGNDKQIVCQPGAVLNLTELQLSGTRMQFDDAVISATGQYGIRMTSAQDVRFNGLDLAAADGGFFPFGTVRFAFISSRIVAYTHVAYLDASNTDMTIANCDMDGDQPAGGINGWCIRWGADSVPRSVLIDSRFHCEQNVTLRLEVDQEDVYIADCQIEGIPFRTEGRDEGTPSAWPLDGLWFLRNSLYPLSAINSPPNVIVTTYPRMQNVTVTGNRAYSPTATLSNLGFPSGQTTWTLSDNDWVSRAGYTPPAWVMQ